MNSSFNVFIVVLFMLLFIKHLITCPVSCVNLSQNCCSYFKCMATTQRINPKNIISHS